MTLATGQTDLPFLLQWKGSEKPTLRSKTYPYCIVNKKEHYYEIHHVFKLSFSNEIWDKLLANNVFTHQPRNDKCLNDLAEISRISKLTATLQNVLQ